MASHARISSLSKPVPFFLQDGPGPFGSKGVREVAAVPIMAAIANAVEEAVGVRITQLPITAEKVLAALNGRNVP